MSKIHRNQFTLLIVVVLFGAFLVGCSTTPAIEKMVPQETVIYLQVPDGETLLDDLDGFFQELGLSPMLQGRPVKEFLTATLQEQDSLIQIKDLDFSMPLGMAVIPSDPGFEDAELMLFLPLSDIANPEELLRLLEAEPETWVALHKQYLVLFSDRRLREEFPPKERANVSMLREYPDSSLQTYVDVNGLLSGLGISYEALTEGIEEAVDDESKTVVRFLEGYFEALESIDAYTVALRPAEAGFFYQSGLHFRDDWAEVLASIKPMSGVTEFAVPVLPNTLLSGALGLDPEDSLRILEHIWEPLAEENTAEGSGEVGAIDAYLAQSREFLEEATGYFGFSVALEPRDMAQTAPPIPGVPAEPTFNYHVAMVFGTEDPERYLALYAESVENQAEGDLFSSIFGGGNGIQQRQKVSTGTTPGGRKYLKVATVMEDSGEAIPVTEFTTYLAAGDGVVYSYLGNGGPEMLDRVATGRTRRFTEYETEDPMAVWALSMKQLVALTGAPTEELFPVEETESTGYLKIDGSVLRSAGSVPMDSLAGIVRYALLLQESEPPQ